MLSIETAYHVGQTVYLKSGSPSLTVIGSKGDRTIVEWQTAEGVERSDFATACLTDPQNPRD